MIDALRPSADVIHGTVESLELNGPFRVRANGAWLEADHVVLATPAADAARLLQPCNARLAGLLRDIPYNSSITLSLGYRRETFDHPLKEFGFLVPQRERQYLAA